MPKKKFNPRTEPLMEKIKEFVTQINPTEEELHIFLSSDDANAIQKYINWQHVSYTNKYKIGVISKFKDSGVKILVMLGPELQESKFMAIPKNTQEKIQRYPYSEAKPQSYNEALENVRGLVDDAYKSMMPKSHKDNIIKE